MAIPRELAVPYPTWGRLRPDTPFSAIFPDGIVPLVSPWPMQPRDAAAPPCYVVAGRYLTEDQVAQLAQQLYAMWAPECASVAEATAYIRDPGLPLRTAWFRSVATTRMGLVNLP